MKIHKYLMRVLGVVVTAVLSVGMADMKLYAEGLNESCITFSDNKSKNSYGMSRYSYHANPIKSYLITNADGTITRFEAVPRKTEWYYTFDDEGNISFHEKVISEAKIVVENYSTKFELLSYTELPMELNIFGGFYCGSDYNWIVFGQSNENESNEQEVYRIVKYTKGWERVGSCSLCGANTYVPFDAGTCRMAEYDGNLFIRTCHTMYATENGTHHQANVTIEVDEAGITVTDYFTEVWNISRGYVSHSFDQFIDTTDGVLTSVDLGDAHPRSIVLCKYPYGARNDTFTGQVNYVTILDISEADTSTDSYAYNCTGVSIGGYEVSDSHYLVAYSSVDQSDSANQVSNTAVRDLYVASLSRSGSFTSSAVETRRITSYSTGMALTPQFVKVSGDQYLLIWEYSNDNEITVQYMLLDESGQPLTEIYTWNETDNARLSDCVPVVWNDKVVWYTSDSSEGLSFFMLSNSDTGVSTSVHTINLPHEHVYSTLWTTDDSYHWHECIADGCDGTVSEKATHTAGKWIVDRAATTEMEGSRHKECTVCGYVMARESIPKLTPVTTPDPQPTPSASPDPQPTLIPGIDMDADTSKYYNVTTDGGMWDGTHYYLDSGQMVRNSFFCDGTYTCYLQADGTPMKDRLTYHPDGIHVIYFDEYGHEVFSNFANVKKTIAGVPVDDYCFFDVNGYLYVDVVTYDMTGTVLYYANPYGVLERGKWFGFSDSVAWADGTPFDKAGGKYGYANADGTLMTNQWTYDWEGRMCYMQGNGVALYQ